MQKIKILTYQNVSIEYTLAQVGDRVIANVLDGLIMGGYALAVVLLSLLLGIKLGIMEYFVVFAPLGLYHLVFEILMNGQTIGMRIIKTKVIRLDGKELTIGNYLLRWLFRTVDITLTGGSAAILTVALSKNGQRLGDMAAGTTVVKMNSNVDIRDSVLVEDLTTHEVKFPEAQNLSDQDIRIIKEVLTKHKRKSDFRMLDLMAYKIKSTLSVKSDLPPLQFLETIIKDHQKMTINF